MGHESMRERARRRAVRIFGGSKDEEVSNTDTRDRRDDIHPPSDGDLITEDARPSAVPTPSESPDPERSQDVPSAMYPQSPPIATPLAVEVTGDNCSCMRQQLWAQAYKAVEEDPTVLPLLKAYRKLLDTDRNQSQTEDSDNADEATQLLSIQKIAQQKLDKLDSSKLAISVGGKRIVVREQVRKLVKVVVSFKGFIGTALSAEPHAALAWAGVMVILPLLDNIFQQDEDASNGFERISFLLIRFCHLEDEVLSSKSQPPTKSSSYLQLIQVIQSNMIKIYSIVYRYQIRLVLQFARNKQHQIIRNMVAADDWKTMLKEVETYDKEIGDAIRDLSFTQMTKKFENADRVFKERISVVTDLQETTLATVKDLRGFEILSQLPYSGDAVFDSDAMSQQGKCLEGTQINALDAIQNWAEDPNANLVFWLQGMAGTGKSSIALTVAECLNDGISLNPKGRLATYTHLGASFFMRHDDPTRNDITKLLPTIARTMAERIPALGEHIIDSVNDNRTIGSKRLQEQVTALILRPLSDFTKIIPLRMHLVIVIDALDECNDPSGLQQMLRLLSKLEHLRQAGLRILLTSRPESYISTALPMNLVYPFTLEKVPLLSLRDQSPDDITIFMTHELRRITKDRKLEEDWVTESDLGQLVKKADGLFIYAATTCRFFDVPIGDRIRKMRLRKVLDGNTGSGTPEERLAEIYLKVLSLPAAQLLDDEKDETYSTYRTILGAIALVMEPVSIATLGQLIEIPRESLGREIEQLHSIINISLDSDELYPLSFFHLSFQDYLLSERCEPHFRINKNDTQRALFARCLTIMNENLDQDMCHLQLPGSLSSEIPKEKINQYISPHLRYACLYWVSHLSKLNMDQRRLEGLEDDGAVHDFLAGKFLYWLEALSLIGAMPRSILIINQLQTLIPSEALKLSFLLRDFRRFALTNRYLIEKAPLQIYCSALVFSPMKSIVRETFGNMIPSWITKTPVVDEQWSSEFLPLEGHEGLILCVAMSLDETLVASGSSDKTTRLWDAVTGAEILKFQESDMVECIAFSADGKRVASGLEDGTISVRDIATGEIKKLSGPETKGISKLAFSTTSNTLTTVSMPCLVQEWDLETGDQTSFKSFDFGDGVIGEALALSPDCKFVASEGHDRALWIWNLLTNEKKQFGSTPGFYPASFSPNGEMFASLDSDEHLMVWDLKTGLGEKKVKLDDTVSAISFSPADLHKIAVAVNGSIKIYDVGSDLVTVIKVLKGRKFETPSKLAFSASGKKLVSPHFDIARVWAVNMEFEENEASGPSGPSIYSIIYDPAEENTILAYSHEGQKIWTVGACKERIENDVRHVTISPDGSLVTLWRDEDVEIWNSSLTKKLATFNSLSKVIFSLDGEFVALLPSIYHKSSIIRILDTKTWTLNDTFELGNGKCVQSLHFSRNNHFVSWTTMKQLDLLTDTWLDSRGEEKFDPETTFHLYNLEIHQYVTQIDSTKCKWPRGLIFSPDESLVAFDETEENKPSEIIILQTDTGARSRFHNAPELESNVLSMAFDAKGDHIAILMTGRPVTLHVWEKSAGKKFVIDVDSTPFQRLEPRGLEFSSTGQIMLAYRKSKTRLESWCTVGLWDAKTGEEKGKVRVDARMFMVGASLSKDCTHLVLNSNSGRVPLPPQTPYSPGVGLQDEAQNCLYVGSRWVSQGFGNLVWIPPVYSVGEEAISIKGERIAIGDSLGRILFFEFDLKNTPLAKGTGK